MTTLIDFSFKFTIVAMVTLCLFMLECKVQTASIVEPNKDQSPESNKNAKQFMESSLEPENEKTPDSNLVLSDATDMGALFAETLESNDPGSVPQPIQWIEIDKQSPGMTPQMMVERVVFIKPVPLLLTIIIKNEDDESAQPPLDANQVGPGLKPNSQQEGEVPESASSSQNDQTLPTDDQPEKTPEDVEKKPVSHVDYVDDDIEKKTDAESAEPAEPGHQDENNPDESNNSDEAEAEADEIAPPQDKSSA